MSEEESGEDSREGLQYSLRKATPYIEHSLKNQTPDATILFTRAKIQTMPL